MNIKLHAQKVLLFCITLSLFSLLITSASAQSMTVLGTLGGANSIATGINARGQIVGYSRITGNAAIHAVLWQK